MKITFDPSKRETTLGDQKDRFVAFGLEGRTRFPTRGRGAVFIRTCMKAASAATPNRIASALLMPAAPKISLLRTAHPARQERHVFVPLMHNEILNAARFERGAGDLHFRKRGRA